MTLLEEFTKAAMQGLVAAKPSSYIITREIANAAYNTALETLKRLGHNPKDLTITNLKV